MANLTEIKNHTFSLCAKGLYGTHQKVVMSVLNSTLAITAFLGNVLIVVALQKVTSLHPPSKLLLRCLAVTDLCVGLITQPLFVAFVTSPDHSERCHYLNIAFNSISAIFGGVSAFTVTAISVDRLLALLLGPRYRQVVTFGRVRIFVIVSYLSSLSIATIFLYNFRIIIIIICIVLLSSIVASTFCYAKIYLTLRRRQAQVQVHVHQGQPNGAGIVLNIARYKKTVSSTKWILITLVACYLPYSVVAFLGIIRLRTQFLNFVWAAAISLVMLNSTLNPFLYCWKMREVREAVKNSIREFWCFSN